MAEVRLAEQLNSKAEERNRQVRIAFDTGHDMLIADHAEWLVRDFRLPLGQRDDPFDKGPGGLSTFRMVRYPGCSGPPEGFGQGSSLTRVGSVADACLLQTYEPAPAKFVRVETTAKMISVDGVKSRRTDLIIRRPDGSSARLTFFSARHLSDRRVAESLAGALGLIKRRGNEALPGRDEADRWISASRTGFAAEREDLFAMLAADGRLPSGSKLSDELITPDQIGDRAGDLVRHFERGLAGEDAMIPLLTLSRLLSRMPQAEWSRQSPRLLAALDRAANLREHDIQPLLIRLSDQGVALAPLLGRLMTPTHVSSEVAISVCRIGRPAVRTVGPDLQAVWKGINAYWIKRPTRGKYNPFSAYGRCVEKGKKDGPPDSKVPGICWSRPNLNSNGKAIYLALRRVGLGAEADRAAKHVTRAQMARDFADFGPASTPDRCDRIG